MSTAPVKGDLRIWHIPQVPGKAFHVAVRTVDEAKLLLVTLADYDLFQLENNIKPDYCNVSGLQVYEPELNSEPDDDGWFDWHDPETDDNIWELIRSERG